MKASTLFLSAAIALLVLMSCSKSNSIEIGLSAQPVQENRGPRWSPKGEKLILKKTSDGLVTVLQLGDQAENNWSIRLWKTENSDLYNMLAIDQNQDGFYEESESIVTEPKTVRGKIWSSFQGMINIRITDPRSETKSTNIYPLSFWYVEDPDNVSPQKVLRFSRLGWMEGSAVIDGVNANILLAESKMDGVIDEADSWALAPKADPKELYDYRNARSITEHAWLTDKAYRIREVHPSGRKVVIEPHDPGMTREEEAVESDIYAPDKNAVHSGGKVSFLHDFEKAVETAKSQNKFLFIDFETTWCGPCRIMDQLVYTADLVVKASANMVAVKVDGDERPELVKKFEVVGYPTMLLLAPDGTVFKKSLGYQSVKQMAAFMMDK